MIDDLIATYDAQADALRRDYRFGVELAKLPGEVAGCRVVLKGRVQWTIFGSKGRRCHNRDIAAPSSHIELCDPVMRSLTGNPRAHILLSEHMR